MRRAIGLLVPLALVWSCARAAPREAAVELAAEHAAVRERLYRDGLIGDVDVQAKMSEYVLRMRRDGLEPAQAYAEFRVWLDNWSSDYPARAAAARARNGSQTGE